jgi:hypothetical protein
LPDEKRAETDVAAVGVIVQVGVVPEQAPPQPWNGYSGSGVAVSVIRLPEGKLAAHTPPQLMPAGELVTLPRPLFVTVTGTGGGPNEAVTVTSPFGIVMMQRRFWTAEAQAPPQPLNCAPAVGVASNATCSASSNCAEHVVPQLIRDGSLVTVPLPELWIVTVRLMRSQLARTSLLSVIVKTHVPVPEQGPDHPAKR